MSTNSLAVIEEIKAQLNKEAFLGSFSDIKKILLHHQLFYLLSYFCFLDLCSPNPATNYGTTKPQFLQFLPIQMFLTNKAILINKEGLVKNRIRAFAIGCWIR